MTVQLNEKQKESILQQCKSIAGSREIIAVCIYGPWVCEYADKKTPVNVLLIVDRFILRLNTYNEEVDDINVSILTVNRRDFERDVKKGWLGEFFSEKLTSPYEPLMNADYLQETEVKIKKRNITELLENLILEFPESSNEMLIENEYFMYEVMMRRAKVFPPLIYSYLNMLTIGNKNNQKMMHGYTQALDELEKENIVFHSDGYIKIVQSHIGSVKKRKYTLLPFVKLIRRLALPPFLSVYSESAASFIEDQRLFVKNNQKINANDLLSHLEEPKKHILFPTPLGSVSLVDKSGITDVARKILPDGELSKIRTKKLGGVFNDVYSLTLTKDDKEEQKFVVKQFLDWSNLKWLPLTVWSFGTTSFAVLGQSRMEKEYAINTFLHSKGFPVPKIFHISHQKRLIFEEYIEGMDLTENIKRILASVNDEKDVELVREVGRKIALAHSFGVSLGDCKPENFIVTKGDDIILLDLEQATRNGNQAWDIAEFLYFAGHYNPAMAFTTGAGIVTKNFIEGYLEAGGNKENVKNAGSPRYTKVFTIFTPPHVLLAMSSICQKMGKN